MGDEKEEVILKSVLWLQKMQEEMTDGFSVFYKGEEFVFVPSFIERNDKKMDRLLTGNLNSAEKVRFSCKGCSYWPELSSLASLFLFIAIYRICC